MNTRLIKILEESIRKHGDKPLTLSHLANMLKMEDRMILKAIEREEDNHNEIINSMVGSDGKAPF